MLFAIFKYFMWKEVWLYEDWWCFEGGGVRGIAHVGAICALAEKGYEWERVAGTSAGSIIVALLAAGYSCSELKTIITNIDYDKFTKRTFIDRIPFIEKD